MKSVKAYALKVGDVMLLPFGKTATITHKSVGTRFVNLVTEHGKTRIELDNEVLIVHDEEA